MAENTEQSKEKKHAVFVWKRDRLVLAVVLSLSLLMPLLLWTAGKAVAQAADTQVLLDDGHILQGVKIGSTDVSGLDAESALSLFTGQGAPAYAKEKLVLVLPDRTIEVPMSELPVTAHVPEAVTKAVQVGRAGGIDKRTQAVQKAQQSGIVVPITYSYDEAALQQKISSIAGEIPRDSVQGSFTFDPSLPGRFAIVEGKQGFTPDDQGLFNNVKAALTSGNITHVDVPGTVSGQPVDSNTTVDSMSHVKLAAQFSTKVDGTADRVSNVTTGAGMVNGKIIKPGETFSVNDTLGPRTKAAGIWKKAPAIVSGEMEEQYGGGLCQVSSTLFNAVARADLEIVQWVHHSIPSHYVTIGCDATINTGGPDFKFKNDTQWPVYIVFFYVQETRTLTCEVWGRPVDNGQRIEIEGKLTGKTALPAAITTTDPKAVSEGRIGKYSKTYKVWYAADGTEIKRDLIDTNYYPSKAPVVYAAPLPSTSSGPTPSPGT